MARTDRNGKAGRARAMRDYIRRLVRVKEGGLIEIRSAKLKAGEEAEVLVRIGSAKSDGKYDFSDLAGKLKWAGDAVAEQRRMRNEW